jgi:hypothetical protein
MTQRRDDGDVRNAEWRQRRDARGDEYPPYDEPAPPPTPEWVPPPEPEVVEPPPAPTHPDPLVGRLRIEGGAYVDDTGPRLPVFLHMGDLIGQGLAFGVDHIVPALDFAAAHGYHGLRSWFHLFTDGGGWWANKPVSKWDPRQDPQRFREILAAGAARGLKWHLASGGIGGVGNTDENAIFDCLADAMADVGPAHFALIEAVNEVRDTGDRDDQEPAELARLIQRVRDRHPETLYALSAYTGHEDRDLLRAWTARWMEFYLVHGERGGRAHDKIRHIFSLGYDGEHPTVRRLGWQGEPWGVGRLVSAQAGHDELDAHVMQAGGVMAAMARQVWTVMSGPGVIYGDQPLEQMPGLREVPSVVRRLPQDLMRFNVLSHAGENKRGQRIHAAHDDVRADYAIDHGTGRYVEMIYGPPEQRHDLRQERNTRYDSIVLDGPWARVTAGQLA